ncbi:MAG: MerC domain-containing protein [Candidatus Pelagibacter sp. TMED239]|nr:MAG: MerC domain-containing protein [Candidatus Pelagibacter sp. TMED239]CAI8325015.1 MAG: Uncharacterised protein [Flavobacteriales bacterium]|tara:strand:- start:1179 stop:1577 length:399 start_codon:yes stop_codon:yes gene_type:complete
MKIIDVNSDHVGVTASSLCMLHCFFTPLLFLSQATTVSLNQNIPFLWQSLNFLFLLISLLAIYHTVKNSSRLSVKVLLVSSWLILTSLIINEFFEISSIPELYTYASSTSLAGLHVYNLKYCRCDDEKCCKD